MGHDQVDVPSRLTLFFAFQYGVLNVVVRPNKFADVFPPHEETHYHP